MRYLYSAASFTLFMRPNTNNFTEIIYAIEECIQSFYGERLTLEQYNKCNWDHEFSAIWGRKGSTAFLELVKDASPRMCQERTVRMLENMWKVNEKKETEKRLEERWFMAREQAHYCGLNERYLSVSPAEIQEAFESLLLYWYPLDKDDKTARWDGFARTIYTWKDVLKEETSAILTAWADKNYWEAPQWDQLFIQTIQRLQVS
jgi:hypothetical protein